MKRLSVLVTLLVAVPATAVFAADLDELLLRGQDATYSAEQIISCSTPDGLREALVRITQVEGELKLTSNVADDVEVTAGDGGWTLTRDDGVVADAAVVPGESTTGPVWMVEEAGAREYLGRVAMAYLLIRDGEPRAELVIDEETGVVVEAVTLNVDNDVYCERRFVSLDTDAPVTKGESSDRAKTPLTLVETSSLPESVSGFELLDQYEDEDGIRFAYYSDGFFSFAVFETPSAVMLPEATPVEFESGDYLRVFTAGQVTYVWETLDFGMALVGDLPPDLHEAVLAEMPPPQDPGLLRRWWRALFG
jgi:hypothetical protein